MWIDELFAEESKPVPEKEPEVIVKQRSPQEIGDSITAEATTQVDIFGDLPKNGDSGYGVERDTDHVYGLAEIGPPPRTPGNFGAGLGDPSIHTRTGLNTPPGNRTR